MGWRDRGQLKCGLTTPCPEFAAHVIRGGLVDEFQMVVCPAIVGGKKRFFPSGLRRDLELVKDRRFGNSVVVLRYAAAA